eukprot:15771793-Heterocapsa_arctica.AAC.1
MIREVVAIAEGAEEWSPIKRLVLDRGWFPIPHDLIFHPNIGCDRNTQAKLMAQEVRVEEVDSEGH